MNILIIADLEGISGVGRAGELVGSSEAFPQTCERLTKDINGAADGAFEGGATRVAACDWHTGERDVRTEMLDSRIEFHPGRFSETARTVLSGGYDGAFVIGAHAMAGTVHGFIAHTRNVREWHDFYIDGKRHGEIGIIAVLAGGVGTPLLLVTGDEAACTEAPRYGDCIETVAVKRGVRWDHAELVPEDEARVTIRSSAIRAVSRIDMAQPYALQLPAKITVELNRSDYCEKLLARNPKLERVAAREVSMTAHEVWDILV